MHPKRSVSDWLLFECMCSLFVACLSPTLRMLCVTNNITNVESCQGGFIESHNDESQHHQKTWKSRLARIEKIITAATMFVECISHLKCIRKENPYNYPAKREGHSIRHNRAQQNVIMIKLGTLVSHWRPHMFVLCVCTKGKRTLLCVRSCLCAERKPSKRTSYIALRCDDDEIGSNS